MLLLNVHPCLCMYRAAVRGLRRWLGDKSSLPPKVRGAEVRARPSIDPRFVALIGTYRRRVLPVMMERLEKWSTDRTFLVLRNRRQMRRLLDRLGTRFAPCLEAAASDVRSWP